MNLNSLAIPGIKLTELPAFLKKNGIEGEEAQKLTEYLTSFLDQRKFLMMLM